MNEILPRTPWWRWYVVIDCCVKHCTWPGLTQHAQRGVAMVSLSSLSVGRLTKPSRLRSARSRNGSARERGFLGPRQFRTPFSGQLLHPAVIHIGDRHDPLATHASVTGDLIIRRGEVVGQDRPACNHRIGGVSIIVRIIVQNDQPVCELAGHIGVVPAIRYIVFCAKLNSMASRITGEDFHNLVSARIDNSDGSTQGIPLD